MRILKFDDVGPEHIVAVVAVAPDDIGSRKPSLIATPDAVGPEGIVAPVDVGP